MKILDRSPYDNLVFVRMLYGSSHAALIALVKYYSSLMFK